MYTSDHIKSFIAQDETRAPDPTAIMLFGKRIQGLSENDADKSVKEGLSPGGIDDIMGLAFPTSSYEEEDKKPSNKSWWELLGSKQAFSFHENEAEKQESKYENNTGGQENDTQAEKQKNRYEYTYRQKHERHLEKQKSKCEYTREATHEHEILLAQTLKSKYEYTDKRFLILLDVRRNSFLIAFRIS